MLRDILAATPELQPQKCVLQDLENVIGIADEVIRLGVKTMAVDFHTEQPVKGMFYILWRCGPSMS